MKVDSLANKVYNELRKKILSNQLVSGTRLKEDIWAKRLDVNRMAVREALTRLLGEQLIETGEKGGYFVKSMSVEDVRQIRELREILELGRFGWLFKRLMKRGFASWKKFVTIFRRW